MLNYWLRVAFRLCGLCRLPTRTIRVMYGRPLYLFKFWNPQFDELSLLVKPLRLRPWVEDSKVWLGIYASRCTEAPAAVIRREVAINEMCEKVLFTKTPVQQEVLCKEGSCDHAKAVVHVAGVIHATHCCVNDWVACAALSPSLEVGVVVFPFNVRVFELEGLVHAEETVSFVVIPRVRCNYTRRMASVQAHVDKNHAMQLLQSNL